MMVIGYCFGIRSERWLCEEVHLKLAYCWFGASPRSNACLTTRPSPVRRHGGRRQCQRQPVLVAAELPGQRHRRLECRAWKHGATPFKGPKWILRGSPWEGTYPGLEFSLSCRLSTRARPPIG
ncbi:hypothetical protein J7E62_18450 [Variovorax paradoxus]|nr:hypothetical protein [Variovorax paradoxus]